nr:DUF6063 family protein [Candidatus Sigynarchaeota archaeon]
MSQENPEDHQSFLTVGEIARQVEMAAGLIYQGITSSESHGDEYHELVRKYHDEPEFREYVEAVANGLELDIANIDERGVYLIPRRNSAFAPRLGDLPASTKEPEGRGIFALVLVAIAAYFYPEGADLMHAGGSTHATVEGIYRYIQDGMKDLDRDAILSSPESSEAGKKIIAAFEELPKESQERPHTNALYKVEAVFHHLLKSKLMFTEGELGYLPTAKFKIQMQEFAMNPEFQDMLEAWKLRGRTRHADH